MKSFFRYLSLGVAVVLTAGSLTVLAVRQQMLKPETYLYPISQAGVYGAVEDILITKATAQISQTAKNWVTELQSRVNPQTQKGASLTPLVGWYVNTLIDKQTPTLVKQVTDNLKIGTSLEAGMTKSVTYGVEWLAGKQTDPNFFAYIPEPDKLEAVSAQGLVPFVVQQWKQDVGVADLPPCSDLNQAAQNLKKVVAGNIDQVNCYSPEIRAAVEKTGQKVLPQLANTQMAMSLNDLLDKYQIKTLANDLFRTFLEVSRYKREVMTLRSDLAKIQDQAQTAFGAAFIFLAIGLILTQKNRMRTLFYTYLWVGGLMLVSGLIYVQVATREVAQTIPEQLVRITDPAISAGQNQRLAASLEMAITLMVEEIAMPVKFLGGAIMILAILGLIITAIVTGNRAKRERIREQQPELFDEVFVEEDSPLSETTKASKSTKTKSTKAKKQAKKK